jgi:hypothetical protein
MASPTRLDSYLMDSLLPELVGRDRQPSAFLVYLYLWHRASAVRARSVTVSLQRMAVDTGLSKSAVQRGIRTLLRRRLLKVEKSSPTSIPVYTVLRPWLRRVNRGHG